MTAENAGTDTSFSAATCAFGGGGLVYSFVVNLLAVILVGSMTQLRNLYEPQQQAIEAILHPVVLETDWQDVSGWLMPSQSATTVEAGPVSAMVLAQQFDQDILGDFGNAWNTFIESGQVWALLIGFVLGYVIRGITTYQ